MSDVSAKHQKRSRRGQTAAGDERVAAADFKARCLTLMNRVRETGAEYIITKHGRPVAKLVPCRAERRRPSFGSMKGSVVKYERPFDPIDADYDVNR
jgi:prevent-host-death family protein